MSISRLFCGKRTRMLTVLTVTVCLAIAAIITCCILLFVRERDFAASSERDYVRSVMSSERSEIEKLLTDYVKKNITEYEDEKEVLASLLDFTPDALKYIRSDDCSDGSPEYGVFSGERQLLTVTLKRGVSFSGFDSWETADIALPPEGTLASELTVRAPHGAVVTVNGKAATDPVKTAYSALTVFEAALSEEYYCDSYSMGTFFGTPEIIAALDGKPLASPRSADGILEFSYPNGMTEICCFTVPYGAEVTVNGVAPDRSFISETGIKYSYLTRFESALTGIPTAVTYQISGLFRTPDVSVTYNGAPLEQENGVYRLPTSETLTVTILAPADAAVKINGVAAGSGEITSDRAEIPIMEGVSGYARGREYLVEYTVSGLLTRPAVTATLKGGKTLEADPRDSVDGRIVFLPPKTSTEPPDKDKVTVKAFATYYLKYVLGGASGANTNYRNATDMTPSKTPAFEKLRTLLPGVRASSAAEGLKLGMPQYSEYTEYTKSAFSATVTLPYTVTVNGKTEEGSLTIKILYVFSGNIRRVVNFIVY